MNWSPFPGGNLQLSLHYREDSPLQSQFRRVESATLHWILNRNVFVDFNGTRVNSGAPSALAPRLERTIYSAFLQARI